MNDFLTELSNQLSIIFDNNDKAVNKFFNCFVEIFTGVIDKFARMRKQLEEKKT